MELETVKTLFGTGKLAQVVKEVNTFHLAILGVSEMRWTGADKLISKDVTVLYSDGNKHEQGVGIHSKEVSGGIMSREPVNDRIITVRLKTRFTNVTGTGIPAPTEAAPDGDKDDFYNQLQAVMDAVPSHDLKILMGDFNAQTGDDTQGNKDIIGKEAMGTRTNNGERLLNLCSSFILKIGGSIFPHKKIHKGTWHSPDGQTSNQIDHICISRRWASSLRDV